MLRSHHVDNNLLHTLDELLYTIRISNTASVAYNGSFHGAAVDYCHRINSRMKWSCHTTTKKIGRKTVCPLATIFMYIYVTFRKTTSTSR
jgi:hypothetical protein